MTRFLRRDIIQHELIHDDLGDMRVFHDAVKDEELTESIKALGIRNPITLRPHPSKPGEYQLVDGRRRRRCNEAAGNNSIPVEIHEMTQLEACLIAFTENVQRDEPDSVGLGFWLEQIKKNDSSIKTQEDLAKAVHKSQPWVSRQISSFNQAMEAIKKEDDLDDEEVDIRTLQNSAPTERHARVLRQATEAVQERVIEMTNIMGETPSARAIERMIKAKNTPQEILEKYEPKNTLFENSYIAYELMEKAGLTVTAATRITQEWRQFRLPWQKFEKTTLIEPIRRGDKEVEMYKKLSETYPTELLDIIDSVAPAKTLETMTKYCRRFIRKLMLAIDEEVKQTVLDDFKEG